MFGFLKDKIKKAVKSISEKLEKKEEPKIDQQIAEEKPVEIKQEAKIEEPVVEKQAEIPVEEKVEVKISEEKNEQAALEKRIEELKQGRVSELKPEVKTEAEIKPVIKKAEIEIEEKIEEKPEKKGFFKKIVEKVVRPVVRKVVEKKLTEEDITPVLAELENGMIEADVAYDVAEKIKNDLKTTLVDQPIRRGKESEIVVDSLRKSLLEILSIPEIDLLNMNKKPVLVAFLGFNGAGKTTSLAKVASWLRENNKTCVFAAADTFRAAAEEQLEEHAKRIGVRVIKHKYGADPAAVIFDAVEHAKANGIDFVLADTAGRAHTNKNLMDQLEKIVKVNKPDLKILVIDSLTGNDALIQAQMFNEVGIDAMIFTKVDVNEKGGAILSVTHELKKPILFLGLGQEYKDFEKFDKEKFVNLLLG